ncbi:hypothetical protein PEAC54167_09295 [Pediococcus acidilactici]|uniref:hypothetical protein n=1 Tax=Pediococcus acidilactici TaxID=1254 RepID=UPI00071AF85D|nr:hypothetical protein [Pediococcus acidilactici]KAF0515078.1 hypothetical protein GBP29_09150 [Pediococcus acidilactici]KSV57354.1 hypothetical protein ATO21_00070 [Pediococcus acidilactici]MCT3037340.1 hypothetical protein [Pediococcus acidilactici]QQC45650.1 hypothetical protein I6H65_09605 [Pediococcus acidilactici]RJF53397.1 hypothetical protein DSN65_01370 [Pediococcus acidilactici]
MVNEEQLLASLFEDEMDPKKMDIYVVTMYLQKKQITVDYPGITHYVYTHYDDVKMDDDDNRNTNEASLFWQANLDQMKKTISGLEDQVDEAKKYEALKEVPDKIKNHIKLALEQYKTFFDEINKVREEAKDTTAKLEKATLDLSDAQEKLTDANEKLVLTQRNLKIAERKLEGTQNQFISILGIFSALIFSLFGGFDAFKEIFTNVKKAPLSSTLIAGSILMMGLLVLIFLLIQSIGVLSGKTYLACGCSNTKECTHAFVDRYPLFITSLDIFGLIFLSGVLVHLSNIHGFWFKNLMFNYVMDIVVLIAIVALIFRIYCIFKPKER